MTSQTLPKSLHWRMRRGMKELDLVLNRWAATQYLQASQQQRDAFDALLNCEDPDIWSWLMGATVAPEENTRALIEQLREYC